jgi:protein PET100, fungi type
MAGPNLEVFKFAVYVFFPVLVFLRYGDPEWYQTNVIPVRTLPPIPALAN